VNDTILVDSSIALDPVVTNLRQHPEVVVAEQQIKVNQQIEEEVAALQFPSVRVNAGYNFNRNQAAAGNLLLNQSFGPFIGLNVQVPIFSGGANKRQKRVAELDTRVAQLQRDNVLSNLETNALRTYQAYQNTLQQLKTERENYELARRLVDLTVQRFNLNVATIIEVREAQRSFEETGFRLVSLSYAAKIAEIELKRLSNQLQP
jgi:outer membrane protein TolC